MFYVYFRFHIEHVRLEDRCLQFVACAGNHLNEEKRLDASGQSQEDPEEYTVSELGNESPFCVVTLQVETACRRHLLSLGVAISASSFWFLSGPIAGLVPSCFTQFPAVGERRPFQGHHGKVIVSGCNGRDVDVTSVGGVFPLPLCVLCATSGFSGLVVVGTIWEEVSRIEA